MQGSIALKRKENFSQLSDNSYINTYCNYTKKFKYLAVQNIDLKQTEGPD